MNGIAHYGRVWVNRRSKKAYLKGEDKTVKYTHHYSNSRDRFQKYWKEVIEQTFGTPIIDEGKNAITTITITPETK